MDGKHVSGKLVFQDGLFFEGKSFGKSTSIAGEIVFTTGMSGYPEALTDPSYTGQILIFTYPLLGNYGVPAREKWESKKIHAAGVIVSQYIDTPSHPSSAMTLGEWLVRQNIPALEIKDTRALTQKIRTEGATLGKIIIGKKNIPFADPNIRNLVDEVSIKAPMTYPGNGKRTILLVDCGAKENIVRDLIARGVRVMRVPWNYDFLGTGVPQFDGIVISNGPGDPTMAGATTANVRKAMKRNIPILGICLGNQILALAAGGSTYKLKFGHRSQNQPCRLVGSNRSYLTTQNHGFAVKKIPDGFKPWFINANDGTNEGLLHEKLPFMSVQFHPEANPGPLDTGWIFDYFLKHIKYPAANREKDKK
ncbi:MAG: carbamoyl phosphate synthase small subunit [Candidatus Liptonbacteria bacterium RIFCSPLOWO2_01_FULL_45_15]|uniref:Carbamoyl phosphate synthase small chain n=1 Tax=Candidatus Liptonbacteria bacterium RIFCSPLOWO2_01_FULL_45_15 TaxID=1798649 RepID=A0A1G2CD06_9BACT|nr:MAG: carbamoyl phosphate synthase small subunit [Candidatus Liptonbacteria bacterium RIFCSPLOWO2_01_FULL_45_15]